MHFPQAFSVTSNYDFNHVNKGVEAFRRSFMMGADLANTTRNIDLNDFNLGRNGLDLNGRMVEIRRSYVDPRMVEVNSRIDYLPEPNQTTFSLTEAIRVTEIIRTQEIVRTKIMQSPFPDDVTLRLNEALERPVLEDETNNQLPFTQQISLHDTRLQLYNQDPNFHHLGLNLDQISKFFRSSDRKMLCYHDNDQYEPSAMPALEDETNNPLPFTQQIFLHDTCLQLYNQDPNSHHLGLNLDQINKFFRSSDHKMLCYHDNDWYEPSARQVDLVVNSDPIWVDFDETPKEKLTKSTQQFNHLNLTQQPPKPGFANYMNLFPRITFEDEHDHEDQDENDPVVRNKRTHSLPHEKYGPYTCPKCRGVFVTSQLFAAHVASHYKLESRNEKSKGPPAKNKSKNIHLLHTKNGLTVLPKSFKPSEAKKKWRKSTLWISDEESSTEENNGGVAPENGGFRLDGLFDVNAKL